MALCIASLLECDVVIEFQACALLPFKRRKHQLVFADRTAQKHRYIGESRRRRTRDEFGHWTVKRAIDYHAQRALVRLVLGNKKHGAPKVRIDHIRMSDQQRTGKIARQPFIPQLTHAKLETATRLRNLLIPLEFEVLFSLWCPHLLWSS